MTQPNSSEKPSNPIWEAGTTRLQAAKLANGALPPSTNTGRVFRIRNPVSLPVAVILGLICIGVCYSAWWFLTRGTIVEERIMAPAVLPSPSETFASFPSLWNDRALLANTLVTLRRLIIGFGLAAIVGVPLGILAGCFPPVQAFLTPLVLFGRNIPIAALIPLTFAFFGIAEKQKVMFIFLACVAFIVADTAVHVMAVGQEYIDTAYTLGAKRRHVILKVLVPLAMPAIFNSLRLLFGLAFGYIMLAETVKLGGEEGGLGNLILTSQRRTLQTHIVLIILIIPIVALALDRCLFWIQRQAFPYRYGGLGLLRRMFRFLVHLRQDVIRTIWPPGPSVQLLVADQLAAFRTKFPKGLESERIKISQEAIAEWRP